MAAYIVRRLLMLIPVLVGISMLVFVTIRQLPGDPAIAILGPTAQPAEIEQLRHDMRLDDPLPIQYASWAANAVRGDFGTSPKLHGSVAGEIWDRLPVTVELVVMATFLSILIGIPSGVISAVKQNSRVDLLARVINILALSIPSFWLATLFLLLPAMWWGYAPPIGYVPIWESPSTNLEQFYLPSIALAAASAATIMRMTRSSVLEIMRTDYVRTARAKGLHERDVVWGHVMKNSMVPVLSIIGLQLAILLGGQVVVEEIFQLPGVGRLLIGALANSDYLVVQAIVLYLALSVVLVNLAVDLLYPMLEPRIKYT